MKCLEQPSGSQHVGTWETIPPPQASRPTSYPHLHPSPAQALDPKQRTPGLGSCSPFCEENQWPHWSPAPPQPWPEVAATQWVGEQMGSEIGVGPEAQGLHPLSYLRSGWGEVSMG